MVVVKYNRENVPVPVPVEKLQRNFRIKYQDGLGTDKQTCIRSHKIDLVRLSCISGGIGLSLPGGNRINAVNWMIPAYIQPTAWSLDYTVSRFTVTRVGRRTGHSLKPCSSIKAGAHRAFYVRGGGDFAYRTIPIPLSAV